MSHELGLVVSGSFDTSVRVWSMKDRTCLSVLRGHKSTVVTLALEPLGLLVASGSTDKQFIVWSLRQQVALYKRSMPVAVTACSLSPTHVLFGDESGQVVLLQMERLGVPATAGPRRISRSSSLSSLLHGSNGASSAAASVESTGPELRDPLGFVQRFEVKAHEGRVNAVQVEEYFAVTGGEDGAAHLWTTWPTSENPLHSFRHVKPVTAVGMLSGRTVTASVDGKVRVWHNHEGHCIRIFRGNANCQPVLRMSFVNAQRMVVATAGTLSVLTFADAFEDHESRGGGTAAAGPTAKEAAAAVAEEPHACPEENASRLGHHSSQEDDTELEGHERVEAWAAAEEAAPPAGAHRAPLAEEGGRGRTTPVLEPQEEIPMPARRASRMLTVNRRRSSTLFGRLTPTRTPEVDARRPSLQLRARAQGREPESDGAFAVPESPLRPSMATVRVRASMSLPRLRVHSQSPSRSPSPSRLRSQSPPHARGSSRDVAPTAGLRRLTLV
jgi:F-box/WD-40 domain protein 10